MDLLQYDFILVYGYYEAIRIMENFKLHNDVWKEYGKIIAATVLNKRFLIE